MRPAPHLRPARRRPSIALALGGAAIAVIMALAAAPSVQGVPLGAQVVSPRATTSCTSQLSNASLTSSVDAHYPNASLMPAKAQAEANALSAWQAVCGSSAFQSAESSGANLTFEYLVVAGDKNVTANRTIIGSLFVNFSIRWSASCPAGAFPAGYPCEFSDQWSANLTTQAIAGPASTIASQRLAQCDTPAQNESDVYSIGDFYVPPPSGVNQTSPTQPNESVADAEVATIWGAVCSSSAYYAVLLAHPSAELSTSAWIGGGGSGNGSTGSTNGASSSRRALFGAVMNNTPGANLSFEWSLGWDADCPVNGTEYPNGTECYFTESWTANLVANSYTGPVEQIADRGLGSGPPPYNGAGSAENGTATSTPVWSTPLFWAALLVGVAAVLGAAIVVTRRARGGRKPS